MRKCKVFVYGTLRKGEANAQLLETATCIAKQCWTTGILYDTGFGYPAMKVAEASNVYGELYHVTEEQLRRLDELEGYVAGGTNNLYERIEQVVFTDKGSEIASMYVASRAKLVNGEISFNDWKEFKLLSNELDTIPYFAYGSCMDDKRISEDGYNHFFQKVIGVGVLPNYSLRFTIKSSKDGMARADIVEEGGRVEGKVYEIPVKALKEYLYRREGVPYAYRPTFVTLELNGKKVQAITFVVTTKTDETAPPYWYEEEILRGAKEYLSEPYISEIKNHIDGLRKK